MAVAARRELRPHRVRDPHPTQRLSRTHRASSAHHAAMRAALRLASRPSRRLLSSMAPPSASARAAPASMEAKRTTHFMDALPYVKASSSLSHVDSVDVSIELNVDAKRSDETVRGSVVLPHSTGKVVRVAVFAREEAAEAARAAGADIVGAEALVEEVLKGEINFERCFATPDVMPLLARAARTLGPKGLMPNPKRGTVTLDVAEAVTRAKGGEVTFRANKTGIVNFGIGKLNMSYEALSENFMTAV